jgi:hypothetical protein
MRKIYLILSILGFILPYLFFIQFLSEYGFDLPLLVRQMFASPVAAFFSLDVIVSSLVLWVFVFSEGRRLGMRNLWVYVLLNLAVGVSLALPLFLYVREGKLQNL